MNDYIVENLKKGLRNNGKTNKTILKSYLKDILFNYPVECKLLITAIDENIPLMIESDNKNGMIVTKEKYVHHLTSMRGMKEDVARNVVECFFLAMDVTDKQINFNEMLPKKRNQTIALICSLFGFLGIDRFYLGYYGVGILKLITVGFFYVGWIVDIVHILKGTLIPAKSSGYKSEIIRRKR